MKSSFQGPPLRRQGGKYRKLETTDSSSDEGNHFNFTTEISEMNPALTQRTEFLDHKRMQHADRHRDVIEPFEENRKRELLKRKKRQQKDGFEHLSAYEDIIIDVFKKSINSGNEAAAQYVAKQNLLA